MKTLFASALVTFFSINAHAGTYCKQVNFKNLQSIVLLDTSDGENRTTEIKFTEPSIDEFTGYTVAARGRDETTHFLKKVVSGYSKADVIAIVDDNSNHCFISFGKRTREKVNMWSENYHGLYYTLDQKFQLIQVTKLGAFFRGVDYETRTLKAIVK